MYYAGIGSRETPEDILAVMHELGYRLAKNGWILRTGGAQGADQAFWQGASTYDSGSSELYLPWKDFEGFDGSSACSSPVLTEPSPEAIEVAKKFHPAWFKLSQGAKKLIARNSHQIYGRDITYDGEFDYLKIEGSPIADCVICWTEGGKMKGGTAQALRIAEWAGVPIFNLGNPLTGKLLSDIL